MIKVRCKSKAVVHMGGRIYKPGEEFDVDGEIQLRILMQHRGEEFEPVDPKWVKALQKKAPAQKPEAAEHVGEPSALSKDNPTGEVKTGGDGEGAAAKE